LISSLLHLFNEILFNLRPFDAIK